SSYARRAVRCPETRLVAPRAGSAVLHVPAFILRSASRAPDGLRLGESRQPCEVARMTRPRPLAILAAAFAAPLALAAPAQACTVEAGYRAPTNLELAAHADAIVLGQVTGSGVVLPESTISVRPLAAIKGLLPGQDFKLAGMSVAADVPPSDPQELEAPHPDALAGACIRRRFAPGATVLF